MTDVLENGVYKKLELVKTKETNVFKVGNRYVFGLRDNFTKVFHILHTAKTMKELDTTIDYESEEIVRIEFNNAYIDYGGQVRQLYEIPENRLISDGSYVQIGCLEEDKTIAHNEWFYYVRGKFKDATIYRVVQWNNVFPLESKGHIDIENTQIYYYNTSLSDIYGKLFYFGVDMEPDYQRGNVWNEEQEVKLIDSIFDCINIGSFVFVEKAWIDGDSVGDYTYEILDGKQRLTAILRFISGKFKYKGFYYHELDRGTRYKFDNYQMMIGELTCGGRNYNKKKVIEQFVRLNESGTSMKEETIKNAKKMLE